MTIREFIVSRFKMTAFLLLLTTGFVQSAHGQTVPATNSGAEGSDSTSGIQFSLDVNSTAGTYTHVPGQWGELHLRLENSDDAPRDLLCTTYFDGNPTLQYGRQVWVPARSRLRISHPILFPDADRVDDRSVGVRSLVIEMSPGSEVLVRNDSGQLRHDRSLLITPSSRNTGLVVGWQSGNAVPQEILDLIVANRVYQGLNNKVTLLADQFLPSDETSLNYLDHLILADNRLVDDFAALTSVRRWLHAGGRLWIMLDRADPIVLERLFGDEFQGSVVDRVGLTSVRVDEPPSVFIPNGNTGNTVEFDEPVDMARLVVSDMDVRHTVNGWPAALTREYGRGRVLITTLGPRGWMTPAPLVDNPESDSPLPGSAFAFVPISPMEDLAPWILAERESDAIPQKDLESFAKEFITYEVPTATLIIGTMIAFLAVLVVAAIALWRWECLEHFGWSGSLLATTFGLLFVGIGVANRYGVPDTIASVYFVQAISGTDDLRADGVMAVYRPGGSQSLIQSTEGGVLQADLSAADGSTRRLVTTDLGTFHWDGLAQPTGLGTYQAATSGSVADRITARVTIDALGVSGTYHGPAFSGTDAILATRQGRIGVRVTANGEFTAGANAVLEADEFLNATLLNDVQDRRRRILQRLFENRNWRNSLEHPQLLVWPNDWKHGFQFGEGLQRQGDTLLMVPLEFIRPPAGTELTIPSPLLGYATCRPPDGSASAGFWDDGRQEWQERSRPSTTWLSVQIPRALLPLKASQARIDIAVSGLMGQIEILGVKGEAVVSLETETDPVGALTFEIEDSEVLAVSDNGELIVGVRAGVPTSTDDAPVGSSAVQSGASTASNFPAAGRSGADDSANYWRIESLSVQLQARTSEED